MADTTTVDVSGEVAAKYMAHKGYSDIVPTSVEKVEGIPCWYFTYRLPEGELELEVEWAAGEWKFVTYMH